MGSKTISGNTHNPKQNNFDYLGACCWL